ncbi:hypothetical protein HGRIS_008878 [Hohenbuehelia grisea]|uniref:NmrA-like domain-containing protein n=1 Tax=Hohenbuehelia grisea TaxID=104357 RepID=A0ABR3J0V0_9AGAR
MSTTIPKQNVVIVAVTGRTGESIARGLAESGQFSITGTVRPESLNKPLVDELKALGITVVPLDWQKATPSELQALFANADAVLSACNWETLGDQTRLIDAAKVAGVKRFVPCDWGTVCPPGAMALEDTKRAIHEYIFKAGVPYTIIAVGFWYEITFPPLEDAFGGWLYQTPGPGDVKSAVVNREHIGRIVARILDDAGTIGARVLANEDEVTLDQVWALADKYAPGKLDGKRVKLSDEEVERRLAAAIASQDMYFRLLEYSKSMYISGHNSEAAARESGWIIARERYPDLKVQTAEEWAIQNYSASA